MVDVSLMDLKYSTKSQRKIDKTNVSFAKKYTLF